MGLWETFRLDASKDLSAATLQKQGIVEYVAHTRIRLNELNERSLRSRLGESYLYCTSCLNL